MRKKLKEKKVGRYETVRCLGEGATAKTYLAKDLKRGGALVAQKIFEEEWSRSQPDQIEREFRNLSNLSHPFIARVLDFGRVEEKYFLVSEFVEGLPLLEELKNADLNRILSFFVQLLEALDYLYFRNVVHLDIKPQNVLVEKEGLRHGRRVRLIDFGLSTFLHQPESVKTRAIGTPPFTAPEFALRRGIDTRSDLYSVGILFYTALGGSSPFHGEDPLELLNQQLQKDPLPLKDLNPEIPSKLSDYVRRLIAMDPKKRPAHPKAALKELQEALGEAFPIEAVSPTPLFEDVDLVFRKKEYEDLLGEILTKGGAWAIEGEEGAGKTFLAHWLHRNLLLRQKNIVRLKGEEIVLTDAAGYSPREMLLIEDADAGPVEAWLGGNEFKNLVLLGKDLQFARKNKDFHWMRLLPLSREALGGVFKTAISDLDGAILEELEKRVQGNPRRLVLLGRRLLQEGILQQKGGRIVFDPQRFFAAKDKIKDLSAGISEIEKKLFTFLNASQVSMDLATLASSVGQSQIEAEEYLENLVRQGLVSKTVEGGREVYRSLLNPQESRVENFLSRQEAEAAIETLYDQGRYRDGLDLFEKSFTPQNLGEIPLILLKGTLLVGAHLYEEVFQLIPPEKISNLNRPQKALALEILGKASLFTGQTDRADEALQESFLLYEQERNPDGSARILIHLGILEQRKGDFKKAKDFYEKGLTPARAAKQADLLTGVLFLNLANLLGDSGEYSKAEKFYRESLDHLTETSHGAMTAQAYLNLANLNYHIGRLIPSEHYSREALKLAVYHRFFLTQGRALLLLSMIEELKGNRRQQGLRLNEAVLVFGKAQLPFEKAQALISRAYFFESEENFSNAEADARSALETAADLKSPDLEGLAHLILGRLYRSQGGRWEEALEHLEAARRYFSEGRNLKISWECEYERGELEKTRGNLEEAKDFFEEALKKIDQLVAQMPLELQESFLRDHKRKKVEGALQALSGGTL